MKVLNEKVVQEVAKGYEFGCNLRDGYSYKIRVDLDGNVIFADYGSQNGWCSKCEGEIGFEGAVETVMRGILENDRGEFVNMRNNLNEKFFKMAESIRKSKMLSWDF